MQDIQVFIGFANFYWHFIQGYSKIAGSLISMLKLSPRSGTKSLMDIANNKFPGGDCGIDKARILSAFSTSKKFNKAGYLTFSTKKCGQAAKKGCNGAKGSKYLTLDIKKAFNLLQHAFTQALIFQYFDSKRYIRIETNVSGYIIGEVFSQLISDDLGQWHLVAYYLHKMFPAKTWYKTYNSKLLAMIKVFKIWKHYLEGYNHKVFVLIDYNNLQ